MDVITTKILVLLVLGLLVLAVGYGEFRPRGRSSRGGGGARWRR